MVLATAGAVLAVIVGVVPLAFAACGANPDQQTCSAHYGVNEAFFGSGGQLCDPGTSGYSTNYCAKSSLGELAVGNTASGNYQAQAGFNTNREPSLTFVVNAANINLGTLSPGTTYTTTATFAIKSYLATGYQVVTMGQPPRNGSYTMQTPASPTASSPSSEQFGINLVANNSCGGGLPASLGAAPAQVPNATYSFGTAAHNSGSDYYDTACKFMYQNGDVIASSAKSSGETDFTISYIFNVTNLTPGGIYSFNQSLVATSTF